MKLVLFIIASTLFKICSSQIPIGKYEGNGEYMTFANDSIVSFKFYALSKHAEESCLYSNDWNLISGQGKYILFNDFLVVYPKNEFVKYIPNNEKHDSLAIIIKDSITMESIAFAEVKLFKNDSLVESGITNFDGEFYSISKGFNRISITSNIYKSLDFQAEENRRYSIYLPQSTLFAESGPIQVLIFKVKEISGNSINLVLLDNSKKELIATETNLKDIEKKARKIHLENRKKYLKKTAPNKK